MAKNGKDEKLVKDGNKMAKKWRKLVFLKTKL